MWSVHVVPNNGTSCLALEEQYQTHVMVRKKTARGVMPNTFEANMRPFMSVVKNKLFSDHFFFQAVIFVYF